MNEEKIYQFNDYVLSYDKSLSDRSCLTISKIQNGEMYLMGELFDGSADVVSMILDSLQTTVNYCKQKNTRLKERIETTKQFYMHELLKRENLKTPMKMSWESVEMFNILDGNK